ncbi:type II toxin-antitoxin system VapC family toxin [Acidobacteria bacterium AB60]|nr:type II toxin-antitoxin system VapC family toxin [Acidobacteria bacterium AB60]
MGAEVGPQAWPSSHARGGVSPPLETIQKAAHGMIAYLDTHTAIKLVRGGKIGREASRLMRKAELLLAPIALLELEYLFEIGRLTIPGKDLIRKLEHEIGLKLCDLPFPAVAEAALAEKWTRDIFDRLLVAQAKTNGLAPLISADEHIAQHYPRTVW